MKKFLALLLCLLMIVTCFAACGDKDEAESTSDVETSETVEDTTTETKDDKKEGPSDDDMVVAGDQDDDNNWTKEY